MITVEIGRIVNEGETLPCHLGLNRIRQVTGQIHDFRLEGLRIIGNVVQWGFNHDDFWTWFLGHCAHAFGVEPDFSIVLDNLSFNNHGRANRRDLAGIVPTNLDHMWCIFNLQIDAVRTIAVGVSDPRNQMPFDFHRLREMFVHLINIDSIRFTDHGIEVQGWYQ